MSYILVFRCYVYQASFITHQQLKSLKPTRRESLLRAHSPHSLARVIAALAYIILCTNFEYRDTTRFRTGSYVQLYGTTAELSSAPIVLCQNMAYWSSGRFILDLAMIIG